MMDISPSFMNSEPKTTTTTKLYLLDFYVLCQAYASRSMLTIVTIKALDVEIKII